MSTAKITRTIEFDMGHRVPYHKSKCRNLHGHRYKVEAEVHGHIIEQDGISEQGMVQDFGDLKRLMMDVIHDRYDHGFMMYKGDEMASIFNELKHNSNQNIIFVPFIPTAENIAKRIFERMRPLIEEQSYVGFVATLMRITVWETPNCSATYPG